MLSRVADSLYWMSRYVERAENVARFIDVNLHLMLDMEMAALQQWDPLVLVTGDQRIFRDRYCSTSQENVLEFLSFDKHYPNSILSCVRSARENARSVREVISSEMWEQLNAFYHLVSSPEAPDLARKDPHEFYTQLKLNSQLFIGLAEGTMSHAEGWQFLNLGRMLERADKTSRILDVKYFILLPEARAVGSPLDNIQWAAVLKSASALEMYRKRHRRLQPASVVDFLIFDREFPRSIQFCLTNATESLHQITGTPGDTFRSSAERRLGRLRSELDYSDVDEIFSLGVHEFLDQFQAKLNRVGMAVAETFFAARPLPNGARE
ncbi:MAG: alpha-E domain-containing protein [Phycisphaerae bacterium]